MFENLSERLERSFKLLKGQGKITEINVAETLKDVRRALLDADVNYKVAKQFTDTVKAKALGRDVLNAVKPGEMMVKIVHDELTELMGGETAQLNVQGQPAVILMSGLQGSGKTTFSGKLAKKLKSEKAKRPLLVACDVYRPAAIDQLKVLGEQIEVPVYTEEGNRNPVEIATNAIKYARQNHFDLVIVDTAGRLPVVGTGEKLDALDYFHPARMADRILGMGDIVSLVEKAQKAIDEKEARELQKKIAKNQFNLEDFMSQLQQIKKMGNIKDLASMIPGVGKMLKDIDIDDNAFKGVEAIINSMTRQERQHPEIINGSRRQRIAKGSGSTVLDVNRLLKQFDDTRKMMKAATSMKNPMKMMRQMRRR